MTTDGTIQVIQYLRVKRRRTDQTPGTLRLEGVNTTDQSTSLQNATAALSQFSLDNVPSSAGKALSVSRKRPTTAVLRRVTNVDVQQQLSPTAGTLRLVDAVLDDDGNDETRPTSSKKRRLTLVESKTVDTEHKTLERLLENPNEKKTFKCNKKKAIRVLNPEERLVDDSLKQVYQGDITPRQHYQFISEQNDMLRHQRHLWLMWSNSEMGNLLHACALWNDAELTAEIVEKWPEGGTKLDGDGRTPYQVADIMGHESVKQVLEAFGLDTTNFVYDLYCVDMVDESAMNRNETRSNHAQNAIPNATRQDVPASSSIESEDWTCQLYGGYGYWDAGGQLMLEATAKPLMHDVDDQEDEDEDEDSNDEGWAGNDYPDEGVVYWGGGGLGGGRMDDDDDDDDDFVGNDADIHFRQCSYDIDGDFDAAYGIYGQEEP